jgi:GABA permease
MGEKARVLVVANRTAESDELLEALVQRVEKGPAQFFLIVPATPRGPSSVLDMNSGGAQAEEHLTGALRRWHDVGLEVEGEIGDPDALAAAQDAANQREFDEIIVSTLPTHLSKWLRLDLPHKVAHATGIEVQHITASEARTAA